MDLLKCPGQKPGVLSKSGLIGAAVTARLLRARTPDADCLVLIPPLPLLSVELRAGTMGLLSLCFCLFIYKLRVFRAPVLVRLH